MKSDDRSILSRVSSWLRASTNPQSSASQELERLRFEQLRLSEELEQLLLAYDQQTRSIASRLVSSEKPLTDSELRKMYEDQLHLWKVIRRLQAAERTIPQLEQEYMEWKGRPSDVLPDHHPDHPNVRLELIASELRSRGRSIPVRISSDEFEGSAKDANPFEDLNLGEEIEDIEPVVDSDNDALRNVPNISISPEMQKNLLEEIRECGKQIQKTSGQKILSQRELADLYRDLRHHHAVLRRTDRRSGVRRYRVVLHQQ